MCFNTALLPFQDDEDGSVLLTNSQLVCRIDKNGRLTSLKLNGEQQTECLKSPANEFVIFDDVPLYWDAWDVMDYHLETRFVLVGSPDQVFVVH